MCVDYVTFKHAKKLWIMGELSQAVYNELSAQYYHSVGAARNAARIPSLSKMEEIKNKLLDLVKKPIDFNTRFAYLGQPTAYKI
jgi:hypothetical protein